ncbi:hypothetical protein Fot_11676 [Forsythia ovata]|uniref:Uncharacterized protein n=1 Tax=Forsythia ovata TaxID=205694 RepID=A0ABD1WKS0_9LAMI
MGAFTAILLASGIAVGIHSVLLLEEILLPLEDIQRSGKRKTVADDEGETAMPRRDMKGNGGSEDSQKTKRDRVESRRTRFLLFSRHGLTFYFSSWMDELDHVILETLPPSSATVAASVHKYWTSVWAMANEGADLLKLIKMAEINTA